MTELSPTRACTRRGWCSAWPTWRSSGPPTPAITPVETRGRNEWPTFDRALSEGSLQSGARCFVHDVRDPLNPEERTKCDAAPRSPFTDVAPSLVGGEAQELPFHRANLVE